MADTATIGEKVNTKYIHKTEGNEVSLAQYRNMGRSERSNYNGRRMNMMNILIVKRLKNG